MQYSQFVFPKSNVALDLIGAQFESTFIIPADPRNGIATSVFGQDFYMGMSPVNEYVMFENKVQNRGNNTGEWFIFPEYCCL